MKKLTIKSVEKTLFNVVNKYYVNGYVVFDAIVINLDLEDDSRVDTITINGRFGNENAPETENYEFKLNYETSNSLDFIAGKFTEIVEGAIYG